MKTFKNDFIPLKISKTKIVEHKNRRKFSKVEFYKKLIFYKI